MALSLCAASAAAHPLVDRGRASLEEADFAGALEALREAEAQGDLTREDLVLLLETRALVHRALGDEEPADDALRSLASIDPDHRFGPEVTPDVVQRFAQLRDAGPGPLTLDVEEAPSPGGISLTAEVRGDVADMVHAVTVRARAGEDGPWREGDGRLAIEAPPGARIEWYAVAYGTAGAPVAQRGSEDAPRRTRVPGTAVTPAPESSIDPVALGVGLAAGIAALVAAAVIVGVVLTSEGQATTRVDGPMWPPF